MTSHLDDASDKEWQSTEEDDRWLVGWESPDDRENPLNTPLWRKWAIVVMMSVSGACLTACTSMGSGTYPGLRRDFGVSQIVCTLSVSLCVLGMAIGPLLTGPFADTLGRRPILVWSMVAFCLLNIPVAFANHISIHLVFRFLSGFFGSAIGSVSGGVIADLFPNVQVAMPMMIFTGVLLVGPVFGQILSSIINSYADWRWTYYTLIIWFFVMSVLLWLVVFETSAKHVLRNKAKRLRRETGDQRWTSPMDRSQQPFAQALKKSMATPFVLLATQKMVLFLDLWSSIILGILYLSFGGVSYIFQTQFNFTVLQSGLAFIGIGIGEVIAVFCQMGFSKHQRKRAALLTGPAPPEARLIPGMFGAIIAPTGLLLFGLTVFPNVPWVIPIICSSLFGTGLVLSLSSTFTYLVDAYRPEAPSALASNNFLRATFAAAFPLFGQQFYHALGAVAGTCLLAALLFLAAPLPFIFYRIGARVRAASPYAAS